MEGINQTKIRKFGAGCKMGGSEGRKKRAFIGVNKEKKRNKARKEEREEEEEKKEEKRRWKKEKERNMR
jgi:hypothetical protein